MRFFRPEIERALRLVVALLLLGLILLPMAWGYEQRKQARAWQSVACAYRMREVARRAPLVSTVEYIRDPCPTLAFVPDVSSGGFVVDAVGSHWQPGATINLAWRELGSLPADVTVTSFTPTTDSFSVAIVLMTHDEIGERVLVADQVTAALSNSAGLLVAASPEEPPTFLFRR